jgi:hypothetical protein
MLSAASAPGGERGAGEEQNSQPHFFPGQKGGTLQCLHHLVERPFSSSNGYMKNAINAHAKQRI